MDQLPALGTAIVEVMQPTRAIYAKLLQDNAKAIKATAKQTYTYGPTDRHTLDVYTPAKPDPSKPIFIFLHGGGLVAGARVLESNEIPDELAYTNLGHFFAETYGYTVVIPNYRLMKHGAKFPSGGEDVAWVVDWLRDHPHELGSTTAAVVPQRDLFAMGHSAGGVHLETYLFGPMFAQSRELVLNQNSTLRLRGVVFLASPFSMDYMPAHATGMINGYWGSKDQAALTSPLGLLRALRQQGGTAAAVLPGVKFLALKGILDAEDEVLKPFDDFERAWNENNSDPCNLLQIEWLVGHNHISPCLSVGTGIPREEAWASLVGVFVNTARSFAL